MTKLTQKKPRTKGEGVRKLTLHLYQRGTNVYLKLFYEDHTVAFSTGISCEPNHLDKNDFSVSGNESATIYLQGLRSDFQRAFTDFLITRRKPDLYELKKLVLDKAGLGSSKPTLIECLERFYKEEFEQLSGIDYKQKSVEKKRYLVERIKRYVLEHHINPFFKLSDVKLIDGKNLTNFCKRVFGHGHNHAVLHAEFLKRTLNYAIANEWLDRNPLVFFKPKRDRKDVVALRESDLLKLFSTVFHSTQYNYVKDVFLFCCYTGLAYNEVKALDKSHLQTTEKGELLIRIHRGKNGNLSIIPVVPQALAILERYKNNIHCISTEKLLPVYANQVMNRILKEVQAISGIEVRLTTHVARKTCASMYVQNGVPLTSVAIMLGHKKTSTTEQYYTQRSEESVIRDIQAFVNRKEA
ncbi:site-specific integrase [Fibrivirga algicola]|uniref:Tyrosine-type recombinase/integrase n=1 Tax=Fibrivirga algicola TaxID=2950420 RepID=A0ABX0QT64_9BACT|nr:site-specific integrase [Fibrivirga algicola]NID13364.1 tyrosine-type recombinase/integrase [Fibrivirga algicola]